MLTRLTPDGKFVEMTEYRTARQIIIPKGTALRQPVPTQKQAVTYAHAVLDANRTEKSADPDVDMHFSIPLDDAIKAGLIEALD